MSLRCTPGERSWSYPIQGTRVLLVTVVKIPISFLTVDYKYAVVESKDTLLKPLYFFAPRSLIIGNISKCCTARTVLGWMLPADTWMEWFHKPRWLKLKLLGYSTLESDLWLSAECCLQVIKKVYFSLAVMWTDWRYLCKRTRVLKCGPFRPHLAACCLKCSHVFLCLE